MKITIAIEATPEEVRETIGLPDLQEVQKTFMGRLSQQVREGKIDGSSLMEFLNPKTNIMGRLFFDAAMKNMEILTKSSVPKADPAAETLKEDAEAGEKNSGK